MTSQHAAPKMPQTKADAASPKVTQDGEIELTETDSTEVKLPLHEDIMQLARLGEIGPIKTLLEEGKFSAKHKDGEGITPLHVRAVEATAQRGTDFSRSGQRSTIITACVNSSSTPAQM